MQNHAVRIPYLLVLVVCCSWWSTSAAYGDKTTANISTTADLLRQNWIQLRAIDELPQTFRFTTTMSGAYKKAKTTRSGVVYRKGRCVKLTFDQPGEPLVAVRNANYEFSVRQKPNGWVLGPFDVTNGAEFLRNEDKVFTPVLVQCIYPLSTIFESDWEALLSREGHSFRPLEEPDSGGRVLATTRIQESGQGPQAGFWRKRTLLMDPTNKYCVLQCRFYWDDQLRGESIRKVTMRDGRPNCESVSHIVYELGTTTKVTNIETTFSDVQDACNINDDEFYLTGYGLPEPDGFTPPATARSLWLWITVAAAVFACLAIVLFYWSRQHRLTSA
jgi:hypothetical protein